MNLTKSSIHCYIVAVFLFFVSWLVFNEDSSKDKEFNIYLNKLGWIVFTYGMLVQGEKR